MPVAWSDQIWYTWAGNEFTTNTTAITTDPSFIVTGSTANSVNVIWNAWQQIGRSIGIPAATVREGLGLRRVDPLEPTPAELAAREARRRRVSEARAREEAAQARARTLLRSVLTDVQWGLHSMGEPYHVLGSDGVTYLIEDGISGNIVALDSDGQAVTRYCVHPELWDEAHGAYLPTADVLVAQMLGLQTDAEAYLRKANVHWHRRPQQEALPIESPQQERDRMAREMDELAAAVCSGVA